MKILIVQDKEENISNLAKILNGMGVGFKTTNTYAEACKIMEMKDSDIVGVIASPGFWNFGENGNTVAIHNNLMALPLILYLNSEFPKVPILITGKIPSEDIEISRLKIYGCCKICDEETIKDFVKSLMG